VDERLRFFKELKSLLSVFPDVAVVPLGTPQKMIDHRFEKTSCLISLVPARPEAETAEGATERGGIHFR